MVFYEYHACTAKNAVFKTNVWALARNFLSALAKLGTEDS